jgi:hypothetical protein
MVANSALATDELMARRRWCSSPLMQDESQRCRWHSVATSAGQPAEVSGICRLQIEQ